MNDNTQYWADKILAIFRAYKKLLVAPNGLHKEETYGVELKRSIDAIHLCKTMPLDRAIVGYWTPDRKASTRVFVPTKYMLLLCGEDPCIWVAGELETWPPGPKTAELVMSWKDNDGLYHAQPWTPPDDYPSDELTEALLWFANLFEYDEIELCKIDDNEAVSRYLTARDGHQDAVARAVGK